MARRLLTPTHGLLDKMRAFRNLRVIPPPMSRPSRLPEDSVLSLARGRGLTKRSFSFETVAPG
jgi:hypothetical protein